MKETVYFIISNKKTHLTSLLLDPLLGVLVRWVLLTIILLCLERVYTIRAKINQQTRNQYQYRFLHASWYLRINAESLHTQRLISLEIFEIFLIINRARYRIRTYNLPFRRRALYPVEANRASRFTLNLYRIL